MTVEEYDEMLRAEGRAEGIAEGRAEGKAEGIAEGRAEGKAEGRAEGKAEGIADSVRNLAECGFSNAEIARMLKLPEGEVSDILEK